MRWQGDFELRFSQCVVSSSMTSLNLVRVREMRHHVEKDMLLTFTCFSSIPFLFTLMFTNISLIWVGWLVGWLVGRLVGGWVGGWVGWLVGWLVGWFVCLCVCLFVCLFVCMQFPSALSLHTAVPEKGMHCANPPALPLTRLRPFDSMTGKFFRCCCKTETNSTTVLQHLTNLSATVFVILCFTF